jgi:hypothetical protein
VKIEFQEENSAPTKVTWRLLIKRRLAHLITHSHNYLTQEEGASLRQEEDATTATIGVSWWFLLCVISSRVALVLYGASAILARVWQGEGINSSIEVSSLLVLLLWIELVHGCIERFSLRKVGWVFPWVWGFPRINLYVLLCLLILLIFSVYGCWM